LFHGELKLTLANELEKPKQQGCVCFLRKKTPTHLFEKRTRHTTIP
jgi:hypothetical protein